MDLHVYRNSQDRWHDLRSAAKASGAILAANAVTLEELVQRLTPDVKEATPGQRLVLVSEAVGERAPVRYALDALSEIKSARVSPAQLRSAGVPALAEYLERYGALLQRAGLVDSQDRRWLAASRIVGSAWLKRFETVVLHALYDLSAAEFALLHNLIERLPDGGTIMLFNATANVKPTQFAEWTWQRFVHDEKLADKTFPEFFRSSGPAKELLERLFVFEATATPEPLRPPDWLKILQCSGRYGEIEAVGAAVKDLLESGADPNEIAVVVRHIDAYGEMIEDVFSRYGIDCAFETGVPLLRIPFIKYWIAFLDLASGERPRDAMARVLGSAYYEPRVSPAMDAERMLIDIGYIDRRHLKASALAARHESVLAAQIEGFEMKLDSLEHAEATPVEFLSRLQPGGTLTERDRQAWQTLCEEVEAVNALLGVIPFERFRRLVSDIAGLRTVDRFSGRTAAPGIPKVRAIPPRSLGYRSYRWLFAPGFADGQIPAPSATNPLLPDSVIDALNLEMRPRRLQNSRDRNRREPLYLFLLLDSAAEHVTLTCPGSTLEGEAIQPSIYVGEILRHFESAAEILRPPVRRPRERGELLRAIAAAWQGDRLEEQQAVTLLGEDVVKRVRWEQRGIARADIGVGVLPVDVKFSPSELDKLDGCPFVFLARHRLRLQPPDLPDFEVSPREVGSLAHRILREFYSEPAGESEATARARMEEIIRRQLAAVDINGQGPNSVIDPSLWKIRRPQLVRALLEYVKFAVNDARDGYETLSEYLDEKLPAAKIGEVLLSGRPDHVAVRRTEGRLSGLRIDDFKYSAASSATNKLLQGSFQIPVYAHLASVALGVGPAGTDVQIEGRYLLLRSPSTPVVKQAVDSVLLDEVRERIEELIEKVRLGRLHPEPSPDEDCGRCEHRRLCRFYGE
jgi:ATP-dependent helicase/DNAse subunit B